MDIIVEGQFDDAEDDYLSDEQSENSPQEILTQDDIEYSFNNVAIEEAFEESDEELTLDSVEWNTQSSNITRQYMQVVGKVAAGTNPQTKTCHDNIVKKYQNCLNLGSYNPMTGNSFRKAGNYLSKNKDKSDHATIDRAFDKKTMMILYKIMNKKICSDIDGCMSTGKEANVLHATCATTGKSLAVKVFKTIGSEFRNRDQYMVGEYRFRFNTCTKDIKKLVLKWAEKEYRNLHRIHRAGINSPEPIYLDNNVLVMEFIGEDGRPAEKLKDVILSSKQAETFYVDCVKMMRTMFQVCKLVHADLSEFNLLVFQGKLYMIDVSQSVEMDNENALMFLKMDVKNVTSYFRKQGVITMSLQRLLEFVMDPNVEVEPFIENAIKDAEAGKDFDEFDTEEHNISRTLGEFESYGKDSRRMDDNKILHDPSIYKKKNKIEIDVVSNDKDDQDESRDDEDCVNDDLDGEICKGDNNDQEKSTNDDTGKDDKKDGKNEEMLKYQRPRDESPDSKKERKKVIKEIQRTNRQNKIPKHEKKRRCKISKNNKA